MPEQALLESIAAGVLVWREGVAAANAAAAELLGRDADALRAAREPHALFTPATAGAVAALLDACRADPAHGGQCEAQALLPREGGMRMRVTARGGQWAGRAAVVLTCVPIEAEKQSEEALHGVRETYQRLIDTIPHHVVAKDADLRYLIVNETFARDFGGRPEDFVGVDTRMLPGASPEQRRVFAETDRRVLESGTPLELPAERLVDQQGRERIWRFTKRPLRDASGAVTGILGESEDETERHRAEAGLRAQQRLLQAVLDQVPISVWVTDLAGRHIVVNRRMAESCGRTPEALIGTRLDDLPGFSAEQRDYLAAQDRHVLQTGEAIDLPEFLVDRPDGTTRWNHLLKMPLRDEHGHVVGQIGICQDITARKQAEAERAQMAAAVEQAGDAVFMTDLDGKIRYTNAAFERLTGFTREEAVGNTPRILKSGQLSKDFYADVWGALLRGEVWEGRYTNRRKDGRLYRTHAIHSPIRDAGGRVTGYLSVQRDITQQVELEERLLRSQRMEALGTLAGGIAHDFNNLLVPIMGYTELLLRRSGEGSEEQEWLELVAKAAQRARDVIARILLFSRRHRGQRVPMQLAPVVQEALSFLQSTLPTTIRLREEIADDGWMLGDPAQFHQALMNLCVNAAQAMPDGGELTLATDVVTLDGLPCYLGREVSGPHVRVQVRDTGVGMDEDTLGHLFEPFFTTRPLGEGTGLGLSTVFGIVQAHEGAVRVSSRPGAGATFELYFPVTDARAPTGGDAPAAPPGRGERVLVVDDEPEVAELARATLTQLGYQVTALTDSGEAMTLLEGDPSAFDLVITDQTMPELSGIELARRLRTLNPSVPIVLWSGYAAFDPEQSAAVPEITAQLSKPFHVGALAALLRRLLDPPPAA